GAADHPQHLVGHGAVVTGGRSGLAEAGREAVARRKACRDLGAADVHAGDDSSVGQRVERSLWRRFAHSPDPVAPGPGRPGHPAILAAAPRARDDQAPWTTTRFGWACSAFGMRSFSTPCSKRASTLSGSSSFDSVKTRR